MALGQANRGRGGTAARPDFVCEPQFGEAPAPRFGHTTTFVGNNRVVLFGGATGDAGKYTITADAYLLDVSTDTWSLISVQGAAPAARAAHAAACVDTGQMVVYGGATGGGSLSSEDLHLLDVQQESSQWIVVKVSGPTPGRRYGHTMAFIKPQLVVFGGNNGSQAECDIWTMDVERSPFQWAEVKTMNGARGPLPRVYHSADVCREGPAAGMMVVFGGRAPENRSLKDTWGLRRHRDGRWDWVEAPTKRGQPPEPRFQHCCMFHASKLLIVGGRGQDVNSPLPTAVYDTETCEWRNISTVNRFRHSCWGMGNLLFAYGGFDHRSPSAPTADLQALDLERSFAASSATPVPQDGSLLSSSLDDPPLHQATSSRPATPPRIRPGSSRSTGATLAAGPPGVRVSQQVFVSMEKDFTHHVRTVAIDSLEEEARKMNPANALVNTVASGSSGVAAFVIEHLLQPTTWQPDPVEDRFLLSAPEVHQLLDQILEILYDEPMLLRLRAPIKVYGDIHGQFVDLMRLFARYKAPTDGEGGDLDSMDYLFLGDFVDRGAFSLETVVLLFALKVAHRGQIHLLRGNHEDPTINAIYGFRDECHRRLGEDPDEPDSCWNKFNRAFEWMPIAAVVEERILCIHGGIGGAVDTVDQVNSLRRPVTVAQIPETHEEQCVTDLLWSDPSDSDAVQGVTNNETRDPDGTGRIFKFGPDRVDEFLRRNPPLSMIIRAHECVMDGFERFADGKLITVFSATDYCGHHKNAGALLFVRRDLTVVPKLIYPVERTDTAWDPVVVNQRPPTPPRAVPRGRREEQESAGWRW